MSSPIHISAYDNTQEIELSNSLNLIINIVLKSDTSLFFALVKKSCIFLTLNESLLEHSQSLTSLFQR